MEGFLFSPQRVRLRSSDVIFRLYFYSSIMKGLKNFENAPPAFRLSFISIHQFYLLVPARECDFWQKKSFFFVPPHPRFASTSFHNTRRSRALPPGLCVSTYDTCVFPSGFSTFVNPESLLPLQSQTACVLLS